MSDIERLTALQEAHNAVVTREIVQKELEARPDELEARVAADERIIAAAAYVLIVSG